MDRNGYVPDSHNVEEGVLNYEYLNTEQYGYLVKFNNFVMSNRDLSRQDIEAVIKRLPRGYKILRKLNDHFDDFLGLLLRHGTQWVARTYCQDKHFQELCRFRLCD